MSVPIIPFFEYFSDKFDDLLEWCKGNYLPAIDVAVWDGINDVNKDWNEFPHRFYKRLKEISIGLYVYDRRGNPIWLQYALRHIYIGFLEYMNYIEYKPDDFNTSIENVTFTEHENLIQYETITQ